jgi:hypothetical protein
MDFENINYNSISVREILDYIYFIINNRNGYDDDDHGDVVLLELPGKVPARKVDHAELGSVLGLSHRELLNCSFYRGPRFTQDPKRLPPHASLRN